jgi:hypothetical protein
VANRDFNPGFRFSTLDVFVLVFVGFAGADLVAVFFWPGIAILFVLGHFFLFCNVIRMARSSELSWAAIFVGLSAPTIVYGFPSWSVTLLLSLAATFALIALEIRKPSYHGIYWRKLNPKLPEWWKANSLAQ